MTAHPSATADVLVIGAGPAGCAAAAVLAQRGHRVIVIERNVFPHTDRSAVLLTPRSLAALGQVELPEIESSHRIHHVRLTCEGRSTSTTWPRHHAYPQHAAAVSACKPTPQA